MLILKFHWLMYTTARTTERKALNCPNIKQTLLIESIIFGLALKSVTSTGQILMVMINRK